MASDTEPKNGGTKPQIAIYQKIASREDEILDRLFELLTSRNDNAAMGAARTLLNKIIPDKKSVEVSGVNGEPIRLNLITGADISKYIELGSASAGGSTYRPSPIQGSGVAQTGTEDNNSNQPISKVGTI